MNSRYRRQALVLAGAVAIAAAASACSSPGSASAGGGGTSAGSPASSGPALTKSPIVIGVMSEQSGPAASADKYPQPVAKAWASWINDNGGINGHPVQIEYGDSQGNPGTGQAQVQQLISDKVVALVGVADSTDAAWAPIAEKAGIPVIGGSAVAPDWFTSPDFFPTTIGPTQYHQLDPVAVKQVGSKSMELAVCAEVAQCSLAAGIVRPVAASLGIAYNGTLKISSSAPGYTAQCLQMKNSGTGVVYALVSAAPTIKLYQDCAQQGYQPYFGSDAGSLTTDLTTVSGLRLVGVLQGFPWWTSDAPVAQYRKVTQEYGAGGSYQASSATATWAALQLFATALAHAGATVTPQDVKDAMYALPATNLGGLLPQTVKYTPDEATRPFTCSWIITLDNGKYSSDGLKTTCASDV